MTIVKKYVFNNLHLSQTWSSFVIKIQPAEFLHGNLFIILHKISKIFMNHRGAFHATSNMRIQIVPEIRVQRYIPFFCNENKVI